MPLNGTTYNILNQLMGSNSYPLTSPKLLFHNYCLIGYLVKVIPFIHEPGQKSWG
jgi:hypothetical protein